MTKFVIALVALLLAPPLAFAAPKEGKGYEEGIRELSEAIVTNMAKEKRHTLAIIDFTDLKGNVTPLGRFVAEELSSALVLTDEVQILDRTQFAQILEKQSISHAALSEPSNLKRVGSVAVVHGVVTGTVTDMGNAVRVTTKVLATDSGRTIGTARTSLSKTGPIAEFSKPEPKPPPKVEKKETGPQLPMYAGELYRLTVTGINKSDKLLTMDLLVENTSQRDLLISCKLLDTYVQDEEGSQWRLDAEHNREGLCIRGVKLPAASKQRATMTFLARTVAGGKTFALHFHETEPRRDAQYTISGIKTAEAAPPTAPAPPPAGP